MITKEDWRAVSRQIMKEGRERIPPPTADQIVALMDGALTEPEAERVRDALSYYPELMRAMLEPFPNDDDPVLTPAQLAEDWAKIMKACGLD
jgi:hypothetical protein